MINAVFVKAMENVRNHRDIELVTTNKRGYNQIMLHNQIIQSSYFQKMY